MTNDRNGKTSRNINSTHSKEGRQGPPPLYFNVLYFILIWFHLSWYEGDYTDEVTGVTLMRDDVAKARMEEMKWYEKFQAFDEVPGETCVEDRTQTHFLSMERRQ